MILLNIENYTLLDFNSLFESIQIDIINDLYNNELIMNNKIKLKNRRTKQIIFYNIILGLCNAILSLETHKKRIIIIQKINYNYEIFKYCEYDDFIQILHKIINVLKNKLPFLLFVCDIDIFNIQINSGLFIEVFNIIKYEYNNKYNKPFYYKNLKYIISKYKLDFLTTDYFNDIKIKNKLN